jgi:hypothetical protein
MIEKAIAIGSLAGGSTIRQATTVMPDKSTLLHYFV